MHPSVKVLGVVFVVMIAASITIVLRSLHDAMGSPIEVGLGFACVAIGAFSLGIAFGLVCTESQARDRQGFAVATAA